MLTSLSSVLTELPLPVGMWVFHPSRLRDGALVAVNGPDLQVSGFPKLREGGLAITGPWDCFTYPWYRWDAWTQFPKKAFTIEIVAQWKAQAQPMGLAGCIFQADEGMRGWSLVIEGKDAIFTLVTPAGRATARVKNLPERTPVALAATYDQQQLTLWANGKKIVSAVATLGPVTFPGRTPFAVGGWWQGDQTLGFVGTVHTYLLFDKALTADEMALVPALRFAKLPSLPPVREPAEPQFVIEPTIQQLSTDTATIVWETAGATQGEVALSAGGEVTVFRSTGRRTVHKVRLTGLQPATTYAFQTRSFGRGGKVLLGPRTPLTTMPLAGQPLRFTVVGDTQDHPEINHQVALGMARQKPVFALIVGDLVGAGWEKTQWVNDFFRSMRPLFADVPLFPVLGNHDRNAYLYYDLMALPEPRYYYAFVAGDAAFFILDTEHDVAPGSEQYRWLEAQLARCSSAWKIVAHHYPPYSSDLDDYGTDLGDLSARALCPLYDRYGVDLVFSGHIHSYERTQPLREGKPAARGTTYLVVGGGGGDLEQFLPNPPAFSVVRKSAHHYGVVDIQPDTLQFRAYDLEGAVFDTLVLKKR